ncbi:NACHT, LRR and PYD domains-containing protein 3-like [Oreochromis aureus]|uniref:NACHT, LRR and PYD domains-containing protein 3-like n=1 Tax=Oreochromis aureus TaxID=47969 RepID=UPI0019543E2B|nr:NACHT, LRR and PYD domains-containing protein 3-like [Oreochromis aureus]
MLFDVSPKIAVDFLRRMKHEELADRLQSKLFAAVCQPKLKSALKKKFECVFEGIAKAGNPTLLNQIYTELYITEGGTAEVNDEHEVRQIETASRKPDRPETTIRQENIFKGSPRRDEPIRTVLTKGVAGIGKTVLTQKYTLDWAEDKANQDIQFILPCQQCTIAHAPSLEGTLLVTKVLAETVSVSGLFIVEIWTLVTPG